jgi:cytochrome P450 family 9
MLVKANPDLIKQIAVKDSEYFTNRGPKMLTEIDEITGRSLMLTHDQEWKDMRNILNPIYTSAKLKQIFYELSDCVFDFAKCYEERAKENGGLVIMETHSSMARVTADGIARTALGFQSDSTRDENCEVFEMAKNIDESFGSSIRGLIFFTFPKLFKFLGLQLFSTKVQKWFQKNVLYEMARRERLNIQKADAIHQLLQAKKDKGKWTDNDYVAQGVTMFLGGFATTTSLLDGIFFELVKNPEVQRKLIEEVDEMVASLNGEHISYDQLNQMKYLEMVVNEGLRMWPPARTAQRYCGKDYKFTCDGENYEIKEGTRLLLYFGSFLKDPKYFPDPMNFDPYRFSEENRKNIQPGTFTPFGLVMIEFRFVDSNSP